MDLKKYRAGGKNFVKLVCTSLIISIPSLQAFAVAGSIDTTSFVTTIRGENYFTLSASGRSAPLCISSEDWPGVIRALRDLQTDIGKVTGALPHIFLDTLPGVKKKLVYIKSDNNPVTQKPTVEKLSVIPDIVEISEDIKHLSGGKQVIIAGTIGKSPMIEEMINEGRIDVSDISGKWECFIIQVINNPLPGIDRALVIAGSDKRGTIYGIYEVSAQIGVSPWYWWADVPVTVQPELYILPGRYKWGEPSVKYRGLFLNDEAPALTNWVAHTYGMIPPSENPPVQEGVANYGHEFYERIFELLLRIRGNYLWPAMWNNAFNEDDPENARLADEYGIVMGTSHQEPMLRAQKEWDRRYLSTLGRWNYVTHKDTLEKFWLEGIRRNKNYESIITIGLRGANDTEMMPGGPEVNIPFLEKIVETQRKMIAEEINPDITRVPQLWCLYKEVLDYYNAGLRVPDDVTLLWAEDNWGNVRRLPTKEERDRPGGAGIYYHFDYHGGPRSYQWINTNPIPKIWDQMSLAKQYGADRIWIVNVGHFKGYEFPLEFFVRLGWDTGQFTGENLDEYTRIWAKRQFGQEYSAEIAEIITEYSRFNGRRKPELLSPETYSLVNYNEAEKVVSDYNTLLSKAEEIYVRLEPEKRDAFYQLILFPVKATALVNELYVTAGKNYLFAKQGRASANDMALKTELLFQADTSLMGSYNRIFAGGKWNHFMDQAHLGYTGWADPPFNSLRAIKLQKVEVPESAIMGIAVEGSENSWPGAETEAVLPEFDVFNRQSRWIDIFNKGSKPFRYTATSRMRWIQLSDAEGIVYKDLHLWTRIDWDKVPAGKNSGKIRIKGAGKRVVVMVNAFKPTGITPETLSGFVEGDGYVSIEAEHCTKNIAAGESRWLIIENFGHTLSAMRATAPAGNLPAIPGKDAPCLEYRMYLFTAGNVDVEAIFSPTLNFMPGRGLRYAISFDDSEPQIVALVPEKFKAQNGNREWEQTVMDNARFSITKHTIDQPGYHTLKIWMIDPGPVLQKIVVNSGGVRPGYLRPPESFYRF
jgi:hypothetical protein